MRITLTFLTILLIGCSTPEWKTYEYTGQNFSISTPQKPEETIQESPYNELTLKYQLFIYKSDDPGIEYTSYSVFYVDLKGTLTSADSLSAEQYFKQMDEAVAEKHPDSILTERRFSIQGYPAKERVMSFAGGEQLIKEWDILVQDKSYTLSMICPMSKKDNADHAKFWNSFKIINENRTNTR